MTDSPDVPGYAVARRSTYSQAERINDLDRRLMEGYREVSERIRWFDPARPHAISHMRRQAKQLRRGYQRLAKGLVGDPFHDWLDARAKALSQWEKQLHALPDEAAEVLGLAKRVRGVVTVVLPALHAVGVSVGITGFGAVVIALISACFCTLVKVVPFAVLAGSMAVRYGFTRKRDFLLGGAKDGRRNQSRVPAGENLYEVERSLATALGKRPSREIQLDVLSWFALAIFFWFWGDIANLFSSEHSVMFLFGRDAPHIAAGIWAACGVVALVVSRHRRWAWVREPAEGYR